MTEDLTKQLPQTADAKLTLVLSTVQTVAVRFDNFEQTVNTKLYEQRSILQKVILDITQLQDGQRRLEGRLDESHRELKEGQETLRLAVWRF